MTISQDPSSRAGPQSVGRVIAMLECVAEAKDGASLATLAAHAGAPKTSLVGLLGALVQEGCLRRETSGRYVLGERMHGLASRIAAGQELVALLRPFLHELMLATGETVVLGVRADNADMAVYVEKVESDNPVRYTVHVGERREMYCTAMGKVLLAHAPPEQQRRVLAAGALKRFTANTITTVGALREELARIRAEGIARTQGERVEGASGLAVPLFGSKAEVVAAILVAGPSQRMLAHQAAIESKLIAVARAASLALGGPLR